MYKFVRAYIRKKPRVIYTHPKSSEKLWQELRSEILENYLKQRSNYRRGYEEGHEAGQGTGFREVMRKDLK